MQKQIAVATAQDLLAALNHPEITVRAATIKAIAADPKKASALCAADGVDLFAELAALCDATAEAGLRAGYVLALLQLGDERGMEFAKKAFLASDDAKITLLTAERIARLPEQERIAFLTPVLMAAECPTKSRAAANLLAGGRNPTPEIALRIALLTDHRVSVPLLASETFDAWLAELQGPYALTARKLLQKHNPDGAIALLSFWDRLPEPLQLWVLREMAHQGMEDQGRFLRDIVCSADGEVLLYALRCLEKRPRVEGEEDLLQPLYGHENPAVRGAALQAGTTRLNWQAVLEREESDEVRLAVIDRIEKSADTEAIPLLARLAEDQNWRIRARVTKALTTFSPHSLPALLDLLRHENENARTSAIQAMRHLGLEEQLKEALC